MKIQILFTILILIFLSGCYNKPSYIGYSCKPANEISFFELSENYGNTILINNKSYNYNSEKVNKRFFLEGDNNPSTNFLGYSMHKVKIEDENLILERDIFIDYSNNKIYFCKGMYGT